MTKQSPRKTHLKLLVSTLIFTHLLTAQEEASAPSADDLAKALSNPVAALISVPIQGNIDFGYANDGWRSTTNIQPVIPFSLNEDWNLISRTIVPLIYQEDVQGNGSDNSGLGDILQSAFFSPKEPTASGWIWGVGPVFSFPAGTDNLSSDSWLAGPTAVFLKQTGPWTYGTLLNHVWEIKGDNDIEATFIQPFLSWGGLGDGQTLTVNAETTYDWDNEQWIAPVNFVYSKVSKIGGQLVSYQAGIRTYLDSPDGGPNWGLRIGITLLFPK